MMKRTGALAVAWTVALTCGFAAAEIRPLLLRERWTTEHGQC
jgi:hypothetical protein